MHIFKLVRLCAIYLLFSITLSPVGMAHSDDCRSMAIRVANLAVNHNTITIIEEIIEHDPDSNVTVYRWRTADAIVKDPNPSGFIQFAIDSDNPTKIELELTYGSPDTPGLGAALRRELRRRYPEYDIISSLHMTNGQKLLSAIRDNPASPDLTRVPAIAALSENFQLELNLVKSPDGQIRLIEATLVSKPTGSTEPRWLNRQEIFSQPLYQEWVQQGASAPLIDSWTPQKRRIAE